MKCVNIKMAFFVLGVVCCCSQFAAADTLWLAGGQKLAGIVLEESPDTVTFKAGVGKMVFKKERIEKVEYDSAEENQKSIEIWRRQYFYSPEYTPPELATLAGLFRDLKQARESAMTEKRRSQSWVRKGREAEARAKRLSEERLTLQKQLDTLAPVVKQQTEKRNRMNRQLNELILAANDVAEERDVRARNHADALDLMAQIEEFSPAADQTHSQHSALVNKINKLGTELAETNKQMEQSQKEQSGDQSLILPYLKAIESLRSELALCGTPENRAQYGYFFEGVEAGLNEMVAGLKTETVPFSQRGGVMLVKARLNDEIDATLILDTGASSTTISKELAVRLGIMTKNAPLSFSVLADGSVAPSTRATLRSLKVGSAIRQDVPVSILNQPPGAEAEGLLGMTFLQHFTIHLNASSGQVDLIHLEEGK